MMSNDLKQLVGKVLESLSLPKVDFTIEHPGDESHGDYSTNVAMMIFPRLKSRDLPQAQHDPGIEGLSSPRAVAEGIKQEILKRVQDDGLDFIEKIEVAGPGFINFYLSKQALVDRAQEALTQGSQYGTNQSLAGQKIVVEYTDPNPFKEFHVGHLYSNLVGESIAKLLSANGATVWRGDFFGDVGMHVAKSLWGILQYTVYGSRESGKAKSVKSLISDLEQKPLTERIEFFGQAYSTGATAYEEDEAAKEEMKLLNFLIFKAAQEIVLPTFKKAAEVDYERFIQPSKYDYEEIKQLYRVGREWSLQYFETIYARLGTKFDGYYPESLTGEYGYGMVMDGLEKGIFEKGEKGAIIFPGKKHGLHDRVFINSLGLPTYETKDFGLSMAKAADFAYDRSVIATGNEINEYFNVVLAALHLYKPELGDVTTHIGHGMVRLPEGKMSSRTGKIIRGEMVLDEAKARVMRLMEEREQEAQSATVKADFLSSDPGIEDPGIAGEGGSTRPVLVKDEGVAEMIAQAAIKYAFLKQSIGRDIAFDFDSSLSFEGNSGPYLQYTGVRARSVMAKAKTENWQLAIGNYQFNSEELSILRWIYRYPEAVEEAAAEYAPHVLANYLYELAQRFNSFYNKHSILLEQNELIEQNSNVKTEKQENMGERKSFRLALTAAVNQILTNGLGLLGISIPNKM